MDFILHGSPTPRSDQRHLLGSARSRPNSGRPSSRRNPITGAEMPDRVSSQTSCLPPKPQTNRACSTKPKDVPSLDLKYLKEENDKKMPVDLYDYSLDFDAIDTPSTVGSSRPIYASGREAKRTVQSSSRPKDVPGLSLEPKSQPASTRPKARAQRPTVWDKTVVPEDIPPPSSHHQQLYQNYSDEMKLAYKNKSKKPDEAEVRKEVEEVKRNYPVPQTTPPVDNGGDGDNNTALQESWTKSRYTKAQLLKKIDAESMTDQYKKQKLIETVMIDQLSRAVISDPEQDRRPSSRVTDHSRGRGSTRYLHDSKISTRSTATENLLSKRVRFGARILTRDGHDAMRELTGFFFNVDNTLTIYEFKQFGKNAKAIPFINRGTYCHLKGPMKGEPYNLTDIFSGGNICVSTDGHQTLPKSLSVLSFISFRVTDVDEKEKNELLLDGVKPSEREMVYASLHASNKEEHENRIIIENIQETVQGQIKKRGVKTRTGLGRYYRQVDRHGSGLLDQYDLEKGLHQFHIELDEQSLNVLFEILDPDNTGLLDYSEYMRNVLGEMNEWRKSLVRKAFHKLDAGKRGTIHLSDIKKFFNLNAAPTPDHEDTNAIEAFLSCVRTSKKQEEISYVEFEEYYEGISVGLDSDEDFVNVLRNTWNV